MALPLVICTILTATQKMNILLVTVVLGAAALTQVSVRSCETDWVPFCSHCYYFSTEQKSWYEASFICAAKGGILVAIDTIPELNWVKNYARKLRRGNFWMGGNDILDEGRWMWNPYDKQVDKDLNDWSPGQPDNYRGSQDCMLLWAKADYRWDDQGCKYARNYICEKFRESDEVCSCRV